MHADRATGPWREVSPERPLAEGFDPSLFHDDDGSMHLLRNHCLTTRLKDDLSGLAKPFRPLAAATLRPVLEDCLPLTSHA